MDKAKFMQVASGKGVTMQALADKMNIKKDTLYKKLVNKIEFSVNEVRIIMSMFDMTFEEVFNNFFM
jgi:DNA-binding XRE family transcriptional regulator